MLALAPGTGYAHEPFSPLTDPGLSSAPFEHFYTYVTRENEARVPARAAADAGVRVRLAQPAADRAQRAWRRRAPARDAVAFVRARRRYARPVMKDPIALLSAPWLARPVRDGRRAHRAPPGRLRGQRAAARLALPLRDASRRRAADARAARPVRGRAPRAGALARATSSRRSRCSGGSSTRRSTSTAARTPSGRSCGTRISRATPPAASRRCTAGSGCRLLRLWPPSILAHSAPAGPVRHPSAHEVRMDSAATIGNWRQRLAPDELDRLHAAVQDVSAALLRRR